MAIGIRVLLSSKDKKVGCRDEAKITSMHPQSPSPHQRGFSKTRKRKHLSTEELAALTHQSFKAWNLRGEIRGST
jgi:hypothetical protein